MENMDTHDRVERVKFTWVGAGIHLFPWREVLSLCVLECVQNLGLKVPVGWIGKDDME